LAKHFGAQVTGVCSGANVELVRSLGADQVIDYIREDLSEGDERYDVIIDAVHKLEPKIGRKVLMDGGVYLDVHKDSDSGPKAGPGLMKELKELIEAGAFKPVIDRRYALDDIVEAHHYVQSGRKKGNVVIEVIHGSGEEGIS
jgi:NADPH:quinone reductase-like Zn-dependent oxidoreductase